MARTQIALLLLVFAAVFPTTSSSIIGAPRYVERLSSWLFSPRHPLDVSTYLPVSRPHQPWPYRSSAAASSIEVTETHALVATVNHELIPGVTAEMLRWWFNNVEGNATYPGDGQQWPKYLMWHPRDHIYQTTLEPASSSSESITAAMPATGASAPLWEICEFFQCSNLHGYAAGNYPGPQATKHEVLIKAATLVKQLDGNGLWLTVPSKTGLGETFWNLRHSWTDTPDGVLINSRQVVGLVEPAWRPLWFARARNAIIRGMFSRGRDPQHILAVWVEHCIEEIGNLEHILPGLYAEAKHGSDGSSSSSSSRSSAAAAAAVADLSLRADETARQNDYMPDSARHSSADDGRAAAPDEL